MIQRHAAVTGAILAVAALTTRSAGAEPTKAQCITANTKAQSLRREGKLAEARQQLQMCGDPKCPALVSTDCAKRLDELEGVQPTLIIDVKDSSGHDLTDVRVTMDGQPLLDKLDGSATAVDLGAHRFTFAVAGAAPVSQQLVIREGEKARPVHVVMAGVGTKSAAASSAPAAPSPATSDQDRAKTAPEPETGPVPDSPKTPQRTVGYVVTGVGVAGLALGGVFGYLAVSAKNRQTANCSSASNCSDYPTASRAHDSAKTNGTISTIAFAAGAAIATVGVVLIATAKPTHEAPTAALTLGAHAGPGKAELSLTGSF